MRRLALLLLWVPLASAQAASTVAISYFDNNTGKADLDPLSKGLADMLITDLSKVESVRIVEREKLNEVLAELKLSKSKFIDKKTAQKLGKGLAAQYVMSGSYALAGDQLRIDARVFKVDTGVVTASEKVEGKKEEFFALEKELVDMLVRALDLKLGAAERMKLRTNATQSYDAWSTYSAGLDAKDRGDNARARELFEAALEKDPSYQAAKNASERLAVIFQRAERQTVANADEAFKMLDPAAADFPARVDQLLISLDDTNTEQLRRKTALLKWLGQRNLLPCPGPPPTPPSLGNPNVLVGGVPAGASSVSFCRPVHEVLVMAFRFIDDPDLWDEIPKVCEYFVHARPGDAGVLSYCKITMQALTATQKLGKDEAVKQRDENFAWEKEHLSPGDWRLALIDTRDQRREVVRIYAKKAKR